MIWNKLNKVEKSEKNMNESEISMEKELARAKRYNVKRIAVCIFVFFVILSICVFFSNFLENLSSEISIKQNIYGSLFEPNGRRHARREAWEFTMKQCFTLGYFPGVMIYSLLALGGIISGLFYGVNRSELIVTDKRVYGLTLWGRRVDLPLDSISAVSTSAIKSIAVTTSSGAIKFSMIANRNEIHEVISNLLLERQTGSSAAVLQSNSIDDLLKYKKLLDEGIITQEEFDEKKRQALNE